MLPTQTFGGALSQWLAVHTLGRKPRAQQFNREITAIILRHWPGPLNATATSATAGDVTAFAARVTHYCPSRWNAIVSALRFITPHARALQRRPLHSKERPLYTQTQFSTLLAALDKRPRSHAGLIVRFLAQTGVRINEGRQLLLPNVDEERSCFRLPGEITKSGKPRVIPFMDAVRETLAGATARPARGAGVAAVRMQTRAGERLQSGGAAPADASRLAASVHDALHRIGRGPADRRAVAGASGRRRSPGEALLPPD